MSKESDDRMNPTRRQFALTLAGTVAFAPLGTSFVKGQTTAPTPAPAAPQTATPPSPVAVALLEVAKARFGEYLTPDEHKRLLATLDGSVATANRLRGVKLNNADEPDLIFSA